MQSESYKLPPAGEWREAADVEAYAARCLETLSLRGWSFGWDRAVRRMGACHPALRRITISRYYAAHNLPGNPDEVREVLLHELAHALAWKHFCAGGHGAVWKHYCALLGMKEIRATRAVEDFCPPHLKRAERYEVYHDETDEVFARYSNCPKRTAAQWRKCYIKGRQEETLGHLCIRRVSPPAE